MCCDKFSRQCATEKISSAQYNRGDDCEPNDSCPAGEVTVEGLIGLFIFCGFACCLVCITICVATLPITGIPMLIGSGLVVAAPAVIVFGGLAVIIGLVLLVVYLAMGGWITVPILIPIVLVAGCLCICVCCCCCICCGYACKKNGRSISIEYWSHWQAYPQQQSSQAMPNPYKSIACQFLL